MYFKKDLYIGSVEHTLIFTTVTVTDTKSKQSYPYKFVLVLIC